MPDSPRIQKLKNWDLKKFFWMRGETYNSNISRQPVANFSFHTTAKKKIS
jgi:hypothetical protein